ncbi:MAG: LptF/LptG family permease [Myxococcota bacterium]|nr:LptF/LptG family permease [Myxococcota bacterium]
MRLSSSLSRYVAREVLVHGALGLAAVAVVFVARNLLRTLAQLSGAGTPVAELVAVAGCIALASLAYALPIGFLFGVLAGVGRLAADGEALALRSVGVGTRQLVIPVLGLGALVGAVDALLVLEIEPRAKRELRALLRARAAAGAWLEPGHFTRLGSHTLWFGQRDGASLERVFLSDRSRPDRPIWVFAERAELLAGQGETRLRLVEGDLHQIEVPEAPLARDRLAGGRRHRLAFASLELALEEGDRAAAARYAPRPRDLGFRELRTELARLCREGAAAAGRRAYEVQLERRLALPAAPLLFAFTAVPLALRRRRAARSLGLAACVALVVAYYALLAAGETLALAGQLPARPALWLPNAALAVGGLLLLRRPEA